MIDFVRLNAYKQAREGDLIIVEPKNQNDKCLHVKIPKIMYRLDGDEEIILNLRKNIYFIVSMYLKNESWVKHAYIANRLIDSWGPKK